MEKCKIACLAYTLLRKELESTEMNAHFNINKIINTQLNKNVPVIKIIVYVSPYVFITIMPSKLITCANIIF